MFLNGSERNGVHVVVGLSNKQILVYKFESENQLLKIKCKIGDINWNLHGFGEWEKLDGVELKRMRESIVIDESCLLHHVEGRSDLLVRLAVEQAGMIRCCRCS
jgi:hypothetical protein